MATSSTTPKSGGFGAATKLTLFVAPSALPGHALKLACVIGAAVAAGSPLGAIEVKAQGQSNVGGGVIRF